MGLSSSPVPSGAPSLLLPKRGDLAQLTAEQVSEFWDEGFWDEEEILAAASESELSATLGLPPAAAQFRLRQRQAMGDAEAKGEEEDDEEEDGEEDDGEEEEGGGKGGGLLGWGREGKGKGKGKKAPRQSVKDRMTQALDSDRAERRGE